MGATGEPPRSIAVELARLFLRELEPLIVEDPERLVLTESVLSFAAVRRGDPLTWQHWRRILEQYEKLALIEYMLDEPVPVDHGDDVVRCGQTDRTRARDWNRILSRP
jgi:hypothetical protein